MRKIYLQVGYPKCFSTTLQRSYFEIHPEIVFGGVGIKDNISYANRDIEFIFESLLKYSTAFFFEKELKSARKSLNDFIQNVPAQKTIVFSSEYLIFPITLQQIDFHTCFNRLQKLFEGYEIHILAAIRRQDTLLKSFYGEYVKMGYSETYSEFIRWVWAYRDRNFFEVLDYNLVLEKLIQIFTKNNIHIQFFEIWKEDPQKYINGALSEILGIENKNLSIKNDNPSLSKEELAVLLQLNKKNRRGMGENILTPFENHRNRELLNRMEAGYTNDEVFKNVLDKRRALAQIEQEQNGQSTPSLYALSPQAEIAMGKMKKEWKNSNATIKDKGIALPENYLTL